MVVEGWVFQVGGGLALRSCVAASELAACFSVSWGEWEGES